ncbi:MAG TPA: sigma-54 dependent transcriptional regulator [Haliscomenobacter sp.]|uniref:sigma-54 interaction domain-containing protein n=1 Tax=Haliscomenobacter sp. TaxID=2717303 RepID=UPI002CB1568E|nr:sigma-54 dependent transcriptional regulator [Haliscomenobacter sp.]HOY16032.1 sigma-54 dependent transcriptional regulator [Haliscomenobacter sp.]HPH21397.1 sigma-54 dependent transcriptional regulator [Haliscomenobacter sp.]
MDNLLSVKQRFGIIGHSPLLDRALSTAVRVANTDLTVLITGESGVGKEVFSKIIHALSARKHNQFIAINCGAIPEGTINSELFGHEKGSFTGATSERKGYFESYDGGTIFLDEIAEMPMDTQAYLLRILESGEFIRVGSNKTVRTDVRIIAATNVDLEDRIKKGKFREDLYFRLNTVSITVPALRDRADDVYLLFRKFASDFAERHRSATVQLDERAQMLIKTYTWPGNVRELKNVAERVSVLSEERVITAEALMEIEPRIANRHLPALVGNGTDAPGNMQERDILYKFLFEMKQDLNDLKSLVFELIKSNDLRVTDLRPFRSLEPPRSMMPSPESRFNYPSSKETVPLHNGLADEEDYAEDLNPQVIIPQVMPEHKTATSSAFGSVEILDDNYRIEDHEKNLIQKALRKYKGRRKEAAKELGISERTLYRKIKQYDL